MYILLHVHVTASVVIFVYVWVQYVLISKPITAGACSVSGYSTSMYHAYAEIHI